MLARERSRRLTLKTAIDSAQPGTLVLDRHRGRTLVVVKPFDPRPLTTVVLLRRRP
jgi:hypothetical protein